MYCFSYAYVCRYRYWVELSPAEDCDGAAAPFEDGARGPRGGAAGRERVPDGGDLAGRDGEHDPGAETVPEGGATAGGGQGSRGGDQCHARRAQCRCVYGVGEVDDRLAGGGDLRSEEHTSELQ